MEEVFVNGKFLTQRISGVQRYAIEICSAWIKQKKEFTILVPENTSISIPDFSDYCLEIGKRNGVLWEQIDLARYVNRREGVLVNFCNSAPIFSKSNIITIHDLGFFRKENWYSKSFKLWYRFMIPRIVRKAKFVITVSQTVQSEILSRFDRNSNDVMVAYNGLADLFLDKKQADKENVFLYVGTISERKNVAVLIQAFQKADLDDFKLVLIGNFDKNLENKLLLPRNTDNIEMYSNLSDNELLIWLKRSKFFVLPSLYEGFGIPILESISQKTVPLISDIKVFKELYEGSALYFDPQSIDSLTNCMKKAITLNHSERIEQGKILLDKYNYYNSADLIWKKIASRI